MKLLRVLQQSRKGMLGTLIIAPVVYATFALLASTLARSQTGCQLASCSYDDTSCYYVSGGVGECCYVCYNYSCPDGSSYSQCRTECGAQC